MAGGTMDKETVMTSNDNTNWDDKSAAVALAHEIGMSAKEFTVHGDAIVQAFARHRTTSLAAQDVPQSAIDAATRYLAGQAYLRGNELVKDVPANHPLVTAFANYKPAPSLAAQDGLVEALEEIADPIGHMQRRAKDEGRKIDGHMAIVLSNDAGYLKGIAREALKGQPC